MTLELTLPGAQPVSASIAISTTTSGVIYVNGSTSLGFIIPVTCTGATLAIHVGATATGTFYDSGITISGVAGVPAISAADRETLRPFNFLKLVSASSEAAARTIYVVTK